MRYLLFAIAAVIGVVAVVVLVGLLLPVDHRASREARLATPANVLFRILTDVSAFPEWRSGITGVDLLSTEGTVVRYRELSRHDSIEYIMDLSHQPAQLVTTIVGGVSAFGGSWTYELTPLGDSTALRITEDGRIFNPLFRFVSRFVFGYHATIDRYLDDLRKRTDSR